MAFISSAILIFTYFSFFVGQLYRFSFFGVNFPLIDISIIVLSLFNILVHYLKKDLNIRNKYFVNFLIFSWIFLFFNIFKYQILSLKPFFYLIRLSSLLSLFIFPLDIKEKMKNLFNIFIVANIIFGFIQYFIWPNFTYFDIANWDPHLYRLVSTYFDPTFTGLIYLFFIIKLFLNKNIYFRWPIMIICYIAMSLTYSRSTFLSFLVSFTFISFKFKNIKILLISFLLIITTIFCLPRLSGEGTKLERTSSIKAKIENYQEGFRLYTKSPIIGLGFNNLPIIRKTENINSHAISGFDSSILTILITTGIIGTSIFLFGFKTFYLKSNVTLQTMILATLVHSLFANSLLYPWILLSFILF